MIERSTRGPVEVLRLAHGKASALDVEFLRALSQALDEASASRALVLTGTGHIFSAGLDLFRLLEGGEAYMRELLPTLSATLAKLFFYPRPVVAAINGHAVAGGCVLACACDHRTMARGPGRIGVTELLVGLPFPAAALEVMRFAVSPERFQEIIYEGRTYAPEDARLCRLVDEVADEAEVMERACQVAETLAAIPPASFALSNGETALSIAAARAPAVVIADIILPGMEGWELAHRLRRVYGAAMRLVALTTLGDPEDRAHSATAGFNVHLVKPVRPGKVHDTILNLLAA